MNCPVCDAPLATGRGDQLDPNNGFTVWCPAHACPAQEVAGHGTTAKAAFEIIKQKFTKVRE